MNFNETLNIVTEIFPHLSADCDVIRDEWQDEQGREFAELAMGGLEQGFRLFSDQLQQGISTQRACEDVQRQFAAFRSASEKERTHVQNALGSLSQRITGQNHALSDSAQKRDGNRKAFHSFSGNLQTLLGKRSLFQNFK